MEEEPLVTFLLLLYTTRKYKCSFQILMLAKL